MAKLSTVLTFKGASGNKYEFNVYTSDTKFYDISAVYIFCKRYKDSMGTIRFKPLYIGESSELGTRIANHEKWECVIFEGCTHICVKSVSGRQARLDVETDLRNQYSTPCNDQ